MNYLTSGGLAALQYRKALQLPKNKRIVKSEAATVCRFPKVRQAPWARAIPTLNATGGDL